MIEGTFVIELTMDEKKFIEHYIQAFYSADCGEESQPEADAELSDQCKQNIVVDCLAFLQKSGCYLDYVKIDYGQAGHDFYLTRQGHGTGYWDKVEIYTCYAQMLSKLAENFGTADYYQGDDGLIYE